MPRPTAPRGILAWRLLAFLATLASGLDPGARCAVRGAWRRWRGTRGTRGTRGRPARGDAARHHDDQPGLTRAHGAHQIRTVGSNNASTSCAKYRRCPPAVRMEVSRPLMAHRVTVFGSTRNRWATSDGVRSRATSPADRSEDRIDTRPPETPDAARTGFLALFSAVVTGSRWSGLTHGRLRQRWSTAKPSGIGPRNIIQAARCAGTPAHIPYPSSLRSPIHSQHPVMEFGRISAELGSVVIRHTLAGFVRFSGRMSHFATPSADLSRRRGGGGGAPASVGSVCTRA